MGRRVRRGHVGSTNLATARQRCPNQVDHPGWRQLRMDEKALVLSACPSPCLPAVVDPSKTKEKKRKKSFERKPRGPNRSSFALSLPPVGASTAATVRKEQFALQPDGKHEAVKAQLEQRIKHYQADRKSFKDENWYRSPIGYGSTASVLLAAFKQQDPMGLGELDIADVVQTLRQPSFGLSNADVKSLVDSTVPNWRDRGKIPYKSFVRDLDFREHDADDGGASDFIARQQSYVNKIRTRAQQLVESATRLPPLSDGMPSPHSRSMKPEASPSPTKLPVLTFKVGEPIREGQEDDKLSFVHDKQRKQAREEAKARSLFAHINRIEEYTRSHQLAMEQQESLTLAAKANQRYGTMAQVFEQQVASIRRHERHGKGLLYTEVARANRGASKDSMFYVDPV